MACGGPPHYYRWPYNGRDLFCLPYFWWSQLLECQAYAAIAGVLLLLGSPVERSLHGGDVADVAVLIPMVSKRQ
ncbi:hypothetical protein Q3G72_025721 [Acer saccharum]|nr:hypothetical protein Q3G72_025721 [Acer saccharum]